LEQSLRVPDSSGPWLVFGLGNPGPEYESTRHNAGYLAIDELSRYCRIPLNGTSRHAIYGRGRWKAAEAILVKPMRYMNRSGWAVEELLQKFGYPPQSALVLCDDVNLQLGQVRLRTGGSAGGQKGLKSIIERLGTQEFPRLRLGIGPAPERTPLEDFVLDDFLASERQIVEPMILRARDAVLCVMEEGIKAAMGRYNRRLQEQEE